MQPFRDDVEALVARHAALEAEVAERTRARDEAAQMLAEARAKLRADEIAEDFASGGPRRRRRRAVSIVVGTLAFGLAITGLARLTSARHADRDERSQRVMAQFEAFTDEACGCADSQCITQLSDKMTKWATEVVKQMPPDEKPDPKWIEKAQQLGERMGACVSKVLTDLPASPEPVELDR